MECAVDNLELPDHLIVRCECGCGRQMCVRHLKAHQTEVKVTHIEIPRLMRERK